MHIRVKNRLLGDLKQLGECIFTKCKDQMQLLSKDFLECVRTFTIDEGHLRSSKEEIKALQVFAKAIPINAKTFSESREILSCFWDQIKQLESEYRQKKAQKKRDFQEKLAKITNRVELFNQQCAREELTLEQAEKAKGSILAEMGELGLSSFDKNCFVKTMQDAIEPIIKKHAEELEKEEKQKEEILSQKKAAASTLFDSLSTLLDRSEALSLEVLVEKWEAFVKESKTLNLEGLEEKRVASRLDAIYDHVQEKRWLSLKNDQNEEGVHQLHALLDDRHKAYRQLKESLDSANLSVEQSLLDQDMILEGRCRLDGIKTMIEEIEETLFDVEE